MFKNLKRALASLALCATAALVTIPADAQQSTLQQIQSRKKLVVAIDLGTPPFGLTNAQQQPEGSEVDTARLMAKDLGVELEIIPVTGPNRIPFLVTGKADMVMASFSITPERAKSVAFSNPYGALKLSVWAPKSVSIKSMEDLKGKRIGVTRGGIQDTDLTAQAPQGTTLVRFDDDATGTAALLSGQVDAMATADHLAFAIAQRNPAKELEGKFVVRTSYYAVGLRQGDPDLLRWVNTWIFFNTQNGQLAQIYEKWIGSKLPILPAF
ncbi:MAG TPA: transporter substrate-binding domain-containing protein [Microvirga sp.]